MKKQRVRAVLFVWALNLSGCFGGSQLNQPQQPPTANNGEYEACQGPDFDQYPDPRRMDDNSRFYDCMDLAQGLGNADCDKEVYWSYPAIGHPCTGIMPICKIKPEQLDARCMNSAWGKFFRIRRVTENCNKWGLCGTPRRIQ